MKEEKSLKTLEIAGSGNSRPGYDKFLYDIGAYLSQSKHPKNDRNIKKPLVAPLELRLTSRGADPRHDNRTLGKQTMPPRIEFHTIESAQSLNLSPLTIYTRYRGLSALRDRDHARLLRHELESALVEGGICASLENDSLEAVCAITPLEWDTAHFGLPMAKLVLSATTSCPQQQVVALLRATLTAAHEKSPLRHVSIELDIDDYVCLNSLLSIGCEVLDIKRHFRWTSLKHVQPPKFLSSVREYHPSDKNQVMDLIDSTLFASRFSRDGMLAPERSSALYSLWLEKLLNQTCTSSIALVYEKERKIKACGVISTVDLSAAGVPIQFMDNGLYLSSKSGVGGYFPIIYAMAKRALSQYDVVQTCVSLNNHAAIRVLEKMNAGTEATRYALRLDLDRRPI